MNPSVRGPADGMPRNEIPAAFDNAAAGYDRLVGVNPGYHRQLRLSARRLHLPGNGAGLRLLDVGCGTGASTMALLRAAPEAEIIAVDASARMLRRAAGKGFPSRVRFVHCTAEDLPTSGISGPFDGILAAYLIRNLADPDACLRQLRSLLRPGARLAVHEYSVRDSLLARLVWHSVCWLVIIPAGRLVTGDGGLFRHLWRSVTAFDGVAAFEQRLSGAGFTDVRAARLGGWQRGIAHTFLGTRPTEPAANRP
jgi:ubiquinone/menaquinone biosynthesis C-methylase UbiE